MNKKASKNKIIAPPTAQGKFVYHNNLIESRYKLTLKEQKLIAWLCSRIRPEDRCFYEQSIKISELCEKVGVKSKNIYGDIEETTKSLIQRALEIYSIENKSLLQIPWLSHAEYLYEERVVKLCFSPKLKPFLLDMRELFTVFDLELVKKFNSVYSIRIYELLKQYQKIGEREFSFESLRWMLGIEDNEYKMYGHLKSKVIKKSVEEINEKSDLFVSFREIKAQKKIVSIIFSVKSRGDLIGERFNLKKGTIGILSKEFSKEQIELGLHVLENYKGKVNTPDIFLRRAIEESWQPCLIEEKENIEIGKEIEKRREDAFCKRLRLKLLERIGEKDYKAWISPLKLSYEKESQKLSVIGKSKFTIEYVENQYKSDISHFSGIDFKNIGFYIDDVFIDNQISEKGETEKKVAKTGIIKRAVDWFS